MTGAPFRAALLLLVCSGCALDYESEQLASELKKEIPDTVMHDYRQVRVDRHVPSLIISAKSIAGFGREQYVLLDTVLLEEYSDERERVAEGSIGTVRYDLKERVMELGSGVAIRRTGEGENAEIAGDSFTYFEDEKRITAPEEAVVRFSAGDEGAVSGKGFSAETDSSTIYFTGGASGSYLVEKPDE